MKAPKRALVIVAFSTLVGCTPPLVPATTPVMLTTAPPVRLYTTTATAPLLNDIIAERYDAHGLTFETRRGNYQFLISQLLAGETAYILTQHLPADDRLWGAPVAQDGIAAILHPANGVESLTLNQLREIYQGRLTNWRELGGADLPIIVISREDGSGTRAEFTEQVMGNRRTTQAARVAPSQARVIEMTAQLPGAIGYVSFAVIDPDTPQIRIAHLDGVAPTLTTIGENVYPLRTTIYLAGTGEPDETARYLINWLQSPAGQAVVSRRYAPLNLP